MPSLAQTVDGIGHRLKISRRGGGRAARPADASAASIHCTASIGPGALRRAQHRDQSFVAVIASPLAEHAATVIVRNAPSSG